MIRCRWSHIACEIRPLVGLPQHFILTGHADRTTVANGRQMYYTIPLDNGKVTGPWGDAQSNS